MIPHIKIENYSIDKDIKLLLRFLNHEYFVQHRFYILSAFPELKRLIENGVSDESAVKTFIEKQAEIHGKEIEKAITEEKADVEKRQKNIFLALKKSMEYKWKEPIIYYAIPTIAPFCPFNEPTFYFSITKVLSGGYKKSCLHIAAHEISHFIFFYYLKYVEEKNKITLLPQSKYFLKEALTAAIFNEEPLKTTLGITKKYNGNFELWDIFLVEKNNKPQQIVDYIRKKYVDSNNFEKLIEDLIITFNKSAKKFEEKQNLWNTYGKKMREKPDILKEYKKAIFINKSPY